MKSESENSLQGLLDSATTPEDIERIERLLNEQEQRSSKWVATSLSEVASFFGLSIQTVKQWRLETPKMPGDEGHWPLDQIVKWRHAKLVQTDIAIEQKRENLESTRLQNESRRLELAKERAELVERNDVELWASMALIEAREMIMSLPEMLAISAPPELKSFVRGESDRQCRAVLSMLRRKLESSFVDEVEIESGEASGAASEGDIA